MTPGAETLALRLAVALGIGLLIGAERERRKGVGPNRAAAGIRTFALASLIGGVSLAFGGEAILLAAVLVVGALAAIAYFRNRSTDPGLTTAVALLTTLLLGALAVRQPALAAGLAVTVAILLALRTRLHRFVRTVLTEQELHDALLFAAAALVVLPLTPDRAVGPFGVLNPRTLWKLVVLVMAISASGYVLLRLLGPGLGLPLSGLASGFVSSAATIGAMGQRAVKEPALGRAAAAGAVLSTVATVVQMAVVLYATSPATLDAARAPLIFAGLAAAAYGLAFALRVSRARDEAPATRGRAFDLKASILFALTVSTILLISAAVNQSFGARGLGIAAAVAGFADTHAAAISVASLVAARKLSAAEAVVPILLAMTTNTLTKAVVAAAAGGRRFAVQTIAGLVLVIGAAWAGTRIAPGRSNGTNASWPAGVCARKLLAYENTRSDRRLPRRDCGSSVRLAAGGPGFGGRVDRPDRRPGRAGVELERRLPESCRADPAGCGPASPGQVSHQLSGRLAPRRDAGSGDDLARGGSDEGRSRGRRERGPRHAERMGPGRRRAATRLRFAPAGDRRAASPQASPGLSGRPNPSGPRARC